jgi:hypothetical protein
MNDLYGKLLELAKGRRLKLYMPLYSLWVNSDLLNMISQLEWNFKYVQNTIENAIKDRARNLRVV